MAGFQPLRRRVDLLDDTAETDDWMAQRNAWVADRQAAEAAGREAWDQATRAGQHLSAPNTDDLIQLGALGVRDDDTMDGGSTGAPLDDDWDVTTPRGSVNPIRRAEPDGPLTRPPKVGFVTARSGDSISKLLGTSDPQMVGRFLALNGIGGRNSTIRTGQNYVLPTNGYDDSPDELAAGVRALQQDNARLAALQTARRATRGNSEPKLPGTARLGPSPQTMSNASETPPSSRGSIETRNGAYWSGYRGGLIPGVLRGGQHAEGALRDTAVLGFRMANPFLDRILSPPGRSAPDQLGATATGITQAVAHGIAHPQTMWRKAKEFGQHVNGELNPWATPLPATLEEARRQGRHLGENDGELGFNVAPLFLGGAVAEAAEASTLAREATTAEAYMARGVPAETARYFAERYPDTGMGAHWIPRSTRLPVPSWFMDSRFNVWKPPGVTRGQWAEHHYRNDLKFNGGPLPGRSGKGSGYSGKRLGWDKNPALQRFIDGMPPATKGTLAGAAAGPSNGDYESWDEGRRQ